MNNIGIITAENPNGEKHDQDFNDKKNASLKNTLISLGCKFKSIKGEYNGIPENAFEIENISLLQLKALGIAYKQKAIVYNQKVIEL